jgi:hypothetical protein
VRIYLKQRVDVSAVDVRQSVTVVPFPEGKWLLKVNLAIHNVGKTRVELSEWRYRADVLLPLTGKGEEMMNTASAFSEMHAPWPGVAETTLTGLEFGLSVEPAATQTESANIFLPKVAEVVQIYSFLSARRTAVAAGGIRRLSTFERKCQMAYPLRDRPKNPDHPDLPPLFVPAKPIPPEWRKLWIEQPEDDDEPTSGHRTPTVAEEI